ncbi:MAG TPA: S8 family serine peptidase [Terriglobales bacterium]|nr:S8 family serine peptidase [Terriglobales bacterium]
MGTNSSPDRFRTKLALRVVLICSLLAANFQSALAAVLPAPRMQAQLLAPALAPKRFIVRDSNGLLGINLSCLLLGCDVLGAIGDPSGQLFVIQNNGPLSATAFLAQLLSLTGIVDAEPDQNGITLAATIQYPLPSYLTNEAPISYYGATVWTGYVTQTPNQIVRSAQTQSTFAVAGAGVTVAIIDTGVDPNNAILQSHLVNGYDFTRNQSGGSEMGDLLQSAAGVIDGSTPPAVVNQSVAGVIDQSSAAIIDQSQYSGFGHGTMTAGIVHLVAPRANIMPLKAFNANGMGYLSDVLRAIYYAVNHGAKVISMSFEFTTFSYELSAATYYAANARVICVASAGNEGSIETVYPAGLPTVIDVASTSNNNTPSTFSNYGMPPVWISAPGEAVMTTYPFNTYAVGWGTSFSAPFVSGTVALMASVSSWQSHQLTKTSAASALSHAQPIPYSQYGYGVLDTYQAVQAWKKSLGWF